MDYDKLSHAEQVREYTSVLQGCIDYFQFAKLVLPELQARKVQHALARSIDNLLDVSDPLVLRAARFSGKEANLTFAGENKPEGEYASSHGKLGHIKVSMYKGDKIDLQRRIKLSEINTVKIVTLGDPLQSVERIKKAKKTIAYAHKIIEQYGKTVTPPQLDALEDPGELANCLAPSEEMHTLLAPEFEPELVPR